MDGHQDRIAPAKHILGAAFDYGHDHVARHARSGAKTHHVFLDPQHQHIPSSGSELIRDNPGSLGSPLTRDSVPVLLHQPHFQKDIILNILLLSFVLHLRHTYVCYTVLVL